MNEFMKQAATFYKAAFGNFFKMQENIEQSTMDMFGNIPGFPEVSMNLLKNLADAHKTVHINFLELFDTGITADFNADDHNWLKVIAKHIWQ